MEDKVNITTILLIPLCIFPCFSYVKISLKYNKQGTRKRLQLKLN